MLNHTRPSDVVDLMLGLAAFPPFCLIIALIISGGMWIFVSRPDAVAARRAHDEPQAIRARHSSERKALGAAAVTIIIVFVAEFLIRGYILTSSDRISWWRFAVPIACATLALAIVFAVIAARGTSRPHTPVLSTRRGWTSFSSRGDLVAAVVVIFVLTGTTVLGGIASSPDDAGRFAWLAITIPNEPEIDPIRVPFYGWTYGVPVLICVLVLGSLLWLTLNQNAARAFLRPETVANERSARRTTASIATRITTAAMLLALAEAWGFIAGAGSGSQLTEIHANGESATYDAAWRYAELAVVVGWIAPLLEIVAFVLLLGATYSGLRRRGVLRDSSANPRMPMNEEATL